MTEQKQPLLISTSSAKSKIFKCDEHALNISEKLQTFYKEKEFLDVTLIAAVDNTKAEAHRVVLSAASDYFLAMFRSSLLEAKAEEIKVEQIDGLILNMILDFMYTASIELNSETVESLLRAADFFQMNTLISACCDYMAEQLDPCNCLGITFFADQHSYTALYEKALAFAYKNFEQVCSEQEFLQLSEEQLEKILGPDELRNFSAEKMFNSLIAWYEHDKANREGVIHGFLSQYVRYPLLTPKFIIVNRKAICTIPECSDMIYSWLEWHLSPETRPEYGGPMESQKLLAIIDDNAENFTVHAYNADLNAWSSEIWSRPYNNRFFGAKIVRNKKLYIVGGRTAAANCFSITNAVECLDLQTMAWTNQTSIEHVLFSAAIAEVNGSIYVMGSREFLFGYAFTVGRYGLGIRVPFFNSATVIANVAVVNAFLFVACETQALIECYNTATTECSRIPHRNEKSINFGMAGVEGYLYVVGGELNGRMSNSVHRYDPISKIWTIVRPLGLGRSKIRCIAWNNRLIACGGCVDGGTRVNLVEEYNPDTNEWRALAPMPYAADSFQLATM